MYSISSDNDLVYVVLLSGSAVERVQVEHLVLRGVTDGICGSQSLQSGGPHSGSQTNG